MITDTLPIPNKTTIRLTVVVVVAMTVLFWAPGKGYTQQAREYQVKAAFIYNFIKFIQWPDTAFKNDTDPFHICIIGNDIPSSQFQSIKGKKFGERTIEVYHVKHGEIHDNPNILFVGKDISIENYRRHMSVLENKPVLIIGETPDFIQWGGVINFIFRNERLGFEISPKAARNRGLTLSSRLLKLSVIVDKTQ
ncbi:MAG: YfiR family protein [Desulfobacteraceae bacterium]|nr:MAG: YfiR family protein [Desulfobacteraceae bacterium]